MEYVYFSKTEPNRVTVVGHYKDNALRIAVAKCSSKDTFSRKEGAEIALTRLYNNQLRLRLSGIDEPVAKDTFFEIAKNLGKRMKKPNARCIRIWGAIPASYEFIPSEQNLNLSLNA